MISLIICTYNRADSLAITLDDLQRLCLPANHDVEALIVDNNGSDNTAEVVEAFSRRVSYPVRCIRETKQGLSHARNRGIEEARGEWIIFTDDDVRIEPDWLLALAAHLVGSPPAAFGGRVLPVWPSTLPRWVATDGPYLQRGIFLHYAPFQISGPLGEDDPEPFGCSMVFHADLFRKHGPFRADLGRKGGRLLAGEDTEMFSRLRACGVPLCYVEEALVHHPVEARRLTMGYFVRWKYWAGYGDGRGRPRNEPRTVFGVPLYRFRKLLAAAAACLQHTVRRNPPALAHHFGIACSMVGFMAGAWFGRPDRA